MNANMTQDDRGIRLERPPLAKQSSPELPDEALDAQLRRGLGEAEQQIEQLEFQLAHWRRFRDGAAAAVKAMSAEQAIEETDSSGAPSRY